MDGQGSGRRICYEDRRVKLEKVGPIFSSWLVVAEHAQFRDIAPLSTIVATVWIKERSLIFMYRSTTVETDKGVMISRGSINSLVQFKSSKEWIALSTKVAHLMQI